jgi:hypothetical protein
MLGTTTKLVEFRVVPACPAAILLGTGALHKFSVGIQFKEHVLLFPDGYKVPFLVTAGATARYGVFLAEEVVLDPHSITCVHVHVTEGPIPWESESVNILVEQTELGAGLKTLHVAQSLADAWQDNKGRRWTITDVANFST